MTEWSAEQRAFAVETYFKHNESVTTTLREFRKRFSIPPRKPMPSPNTIRRWVNNFRSTSSALKNPPPGPRRWSRTPENIERVRTAIIESPGRSAKKHSDALNISNSTVKRILHEDLGLHPYKLVITQQLQPNDPKARKLFSTVMLQKIRSGEIPLNSIIISDEAHFHLTGSVNKQNCRYWLPENPEIIHEKPLHSPKVTVWAGVAEFGIIGPYFFEGTVNTERYVELIENFVVPELKRKRKYSSAWFQQDGATCHTSTVTLNVLKKHFKDRIISRGTSILWPPRSPDLSVCDFFLWGYLKSRVYINKPRDLEQLSANIRSEITNIPHPMLKKVFVNFVKRLEECKKLDGAHLSCHFCN